MSFPRAPIKRFNEPADSSIPPPGTYDPKFVTDVAAVATALKTGSGFDKWGRSHHSTTATNGFGTAAGAHSGSGGVISKRSRSSSVGVSINVNELVKTSRSRFQFNSAATQSSPRISRNASATKVNITRNVSAARLSRRSSTIGTHAGTESLMFTPTRRTSNARVAGNSVSKSKIIKPPSPYLSRLNNSGLQQRVPSTSSDPPFQINENLLIDTMKTTDTWDQASAVNADKIFTENKQHTHTQGDDDLEPGEVYDHTSPHTPQTISYLARSLRDGTSSSSVPPSNIFDEIQALAESLQNELSDYKMQLAKERIRNQELDAKRLELEFISHTLKRQLEKYEDAKDSWQVGELNNRFKLDEVIREKDEVEVKLEDLQKQLDRAGETEQTLQKKVSQLAKEKLKWQQEKKELEEVIEGSKYLLKDEQRKRGQVEDKIHQLEAQMDTCYHSCESRMADSENMKDTYEVKIQNLMEQVKELESKLEGARREVETHKTLMELMKGERGENNNNKTTIEVEKNQEEEKTILCKSTDNVENFQLHVD